MQAPTITTIEALAHMAREGAYLSHQYGQMRIIVPRDEEHEKRTGDRAEIYRITERTYKAMQARLEKQGLRIYDDMPLTLRHEPNFAWVDSAPILSTIQKIKDQA